MKIKTIKKAIAMFSLVAVSVCTMGMGAVVAGNTATTGLVRDTSGGANPVVKAKWEMNATRDVTAGKYLGTDDATTAGAQFMPSGQYQVNKTIALCAVVTDPDGLADIDAVYADVFYPEGISLGDSHTPLDDQSGLGCGELMQEDTLTRLSLVDGYELFCNKVKNGNNNLPVFNTGYDYDEICNIDTGELMKLTAAVYCGDKTISYEDPSGNYKVWAVAQDKVGLQGTLENYFTYLPLTAFEKDFSAVNYGNVKLNTHKIISGDLAWDGLNNGTSPATIRNVGNTRLSMRVMQDDMGLGVTDGAYNVLYDGRVGSDAGFVNYWPNQLRALPNPLDLSERNEIDFSILISKFPPTNPGPDYIGTMTLSAVSAPHLTECIN